MTADELRWLRRHTQAVRMVICAALSGLVLGAISFLLQRQVYAGAPGGALKPALLLGLQLAYVTPGLLFLYGLWRMADLGNTPSRQNPKMLGISVRHLGVLLCAAILVAAVPLGYFIPAMHAWCSAPDMIAIAMMVGLIATLLALNRRVRRLANHAGMEDLVPRTRTVGRYWLASGALFTSGVVGWVAGHEWTVCILPLALSGVLISGTLILKAPGLIVRRSALAASREGAAVASENEQ